MFCLSYACPKKGKKAKNVKNRGESYIDGKGNIVYNKISIKGRKRGGHTNKERLSNIPEEPGVYLMKDKNGKIIYVGKAKILKNRVRQYFQNQERHAPKVRAMVANIADFEYILTDSELEALILECNLIKKYRPYYNILLKDDKNYPYIKVTIQENYPKIFLSRKMLKDGAKYFGPYTSSAAVREAIDMVSKLYKIPSCQIKLPRDMGKKRACLNAHIGQCIAPCENMISEQEYKKIIFDACRFLDGDHEELLKHLEQNMLQASEELEFEKAAVFRDKMESIQKIDEKQKIISERQADEDAIGFYQQENKTFAEIFFIRRGRLLGRHLVILDKTKDMEEGEIVSDFLKQFYHEAGYIPPKIYTQYDSEELELISQWLTRKKGQKVTVSCPKRGEKKNVVEMAYKNARQAAVDYILKRSNNKKSISKTILSLKEELALPAPPYRIEAYDISNTGGADSVGSMIVFLDGQPAKRFYRRFKIETVAGSDDYKSMAEVIYRRLKEAREEELLIESGKMAREEAKFLPKPDCIFLDGGKGHLSVISDLMELLDQDIPLFGMVKDDKHRTRALMNVHQEEIAFKKSSESFHLITRIQDEVHRFAIDYHKNLRRKTMTGSVLEEIAGVGPATRKKLMKHFKTLTAIKNASAEDFVRELGINAKIAGNIFNFFHEKS